MDVGKPLRYHRSQDLHSFEKEKGSTMPFLVTWAIFSGKGNI